MIYPIGSKIWGDRLIKCEVLKVQRKKSTGEIRYWVKCPDGDRFIFPNQITGAEAPFQPGDRVGKLHHLGWWGKVTASAQGDQIEVLWDYDQYPVLEKISELKLRVL